MILELIFAKLLSRALLENGVFGLGRQFSVSWKNSWKNSIVAQKKEIFNQLDFLIPFSYSLLVCKYIIFFLKTSLNTLVFLNFQKVPLNFLTTNM